MDQTGAYFRKTIGVVPHNSDEDRHAATVHTARHSKDKEDFLDLADALGLNDVVDDMTEPGWRGE
jgi:hypothetical protein